MKDLMVHHGLFDAINAEAALETNLDKKKAVNHDSKAQRNLAILILNWLYGRN